MNDDNLTREKKLEHFKSLLQHAEELVRATNAFEHAALKPLMLLNGGALVATITLLAAIGIPDAWLEKALILAALSAWAAGLVFGTVAVGKGFGSQLAF